MPSPHLQIHISSFIRFRLDTSNVAPIDSIVNWIRE
ncbi:uncharacterized protein METZ01_LOCUS283524, partial [marine metagenome]